MLVLSRFGAVDGRRQGQRTKREQRKSEYGQRGRDMQEVLELVRKDGNAWKAGHTLYDD